MLQGPRQRSLCPLPGDIDPWHKLSVVRNGTKEDKDRAVLIEGAAHCADMNRAGFKDSTALRKARQVSGTGMEEGTGTAVGKGEIEGRGEREQYRAWKTRTSVLYLHCK